MKKYQPHCSLHAPMLAILVAGMVLTACDNQLNISPTVPTYSDFDDSVGGLRTLSITGTLAAEKRSCEKATILFNGAEIPGARSLCQEAEGCAELELAGVISAPAGHHTITFKVLRQRVDSDEYLVTGSVEFAGIDLGFLEPFALELQPKRATLQPGEGVTYEIELLD